MESSKIEKILRGTIQNKNLPEYVWNYMAEMIKEEPPQVSSFLYLANSP